MSPISAQSKDQLQQENIRLLALIEQKDQTIQNLTHQLHLFRTARFGRKTEKDVVSEQLSLQFDEAVPSDEPEASNDISDTQTITYTRTKKSTGREPLPKSLPYVEVVHDLTAEEKQCACGCALTPISQEVTERLDVVPQMTFRVVHIRKKYACKSCQDTIRLASLPEAFMSKSIATPGLVAAVIDAKFNRHMPLYRQEAMFAAASLTVTRGTLSNWLIKAAHLLTPLVKLLEADIQDYDIAYADETSVQVLQEKDRLPTQKSTMWLFMGGPPDKRAIVYQYHTTRAHHIPLDFFADFAGYVHADCYQAYVALGQTKAIHHVACWAHARRYFYEVAKTAKKTGLAQQLVNFIAKLYHLEAQLKEKNASPHRIFMMRAQKARPILAQIKELIMQGRLNTPPKSPLGVALSYTFTHWDALTMYLCDARLDIDNNRSERTIKPFVIGRKNWLFHGNELGANAGSILFSLIETCKQNNIEPFAWLKYTLANIQQATTITQLEALLPYNIDKAKLLSMHRLPNLIFPA